MDKLRKLFRIGYLAISGGNRAEAARKLGISRQSLYTKLAAFKLG